MSAETDAAIANDRDSRHLIDRIIHLRDRAAVSLYHWHTILEDAEHFRSPTNAANAKEQIVWMRGYLRALDDIIKLMEH